MIIKILILVVVGVICFMGGMKFGDSAIIRGGACFIGGMLFAAFVITRHRSREEK